MGREVPFKAEHICDECGKSGAFDFYGDYYCEECVAEAFPSGDDQCGS